MGKEPQSVVVAVAKVYDGVKVDAVAPDEVRLAPGDRMEIKFTFDLEEASSEKEEYRFVLQSSLAGEAKEPAEAVFKDTWGAPESMMGYVSHKYDFAKAGAYEIEFGALAEYSRRKWFKKDDEGRTVDQMASGSLIVRVA